MTNNPSSLEQENTVAIPVQSANRIEFIDIIRGFAVLGIFVANMFSYSGQHGGVYSWPTFPDRVVVVLTEFLVRAKFYSLFSFLFGWGMAIHLIRAKGRGTNFLPVYLRRISILLGIGLIHGLLIWNGDILTLYAVLGFVLILFRNRSARFVLIAGIAALTFNLFLNSPLHAAESLRTWYGELIARFQWNTYPISYYTTGTYWEITLRRVQEFVGGNAFFLYFFGPVFSMFLLGLYVGKRQIFQNIDSHLGLIKRVMWSGLIIGVALNALFAITRIWNDLGWPVLIPSEYHRFFTIGVRTIGAPALMLFYVTAIILLSRSKRWHASWAPLANVGRMALTNYLLQSVLSTLIFYNYGLGLFQDVGPTFGLILTLIIFGIQIQFSAWWMNRFQFGPLEWVWRALTYGSSPPIRQGDT